MANGDEWRAPVITFVPTGVVVVVIVLAVAVITVIVIIIMTPSSLVSS